MPKIKLAITDDSELFRRSFIKLLSTEKDFECIFEAENGIDLLEKLKASIPDIILMDIRMPIMDGVTATDHVRELYPQIKIIALSLYDFESNIVKMYIHGVRSFLGKEDSPDELFRAIRIVHQGGAYMTDKSIEIVQRKLNKNVCTMEFDSTELLNLSQTELKIIWYVSQLKSVKEIAELLFISPNTVNNHEVNIRHKLNLNGRNSLQQYSVNVKERLKLVEGSVKLEKW